LKSNRRSTARVKADPHNMGSMGGNHAEGLLGVMNDPRYLAYISHFNRDRDYFECHEVMEELWLEEGRSPLLQGLLQAAVGLHHWDNGNRSGATKLMTAALGKLSSYADVVLGLELSSLRHNLEQSLTALSKMPVDAPFQAFQLEVCDPALNAAVKVWEQSTKT
jgi:predicted metal-dependent hydrolase